jgi:hypothetical protein
MSFQDMKLVELKAIAESFGVDTPTKITKNQIIDLLTEEGVTYEMYAHFDKIEKEKSCKRRGVKRHASTIFC